MMNKFKIENIELQKIIMPNINSDNYEISVLRIDKVHPHISGNKWFKLKYNLVEAKKLNHTKLLTFGGAYSNHIYAVAAAGKEFGFETIAIIRGEEHVPLNPTLQFAFESGMNLFYLDRTTYKSRNEKYFQEEMKIKFDNPYIIPEGGTNQFALMGVEEIINFIKEDYDFICTACGTGGTISGLISSLKGEKNILGFPVLRGGEFLREIIESLVWERTNQYFNNWELFTDFHFGGYAKIDLELIKFVEDFQSRNNLKLDYIYTSKMFFGINKLLENERFQKGSKLVLVHTGGLQGNSGMEYYLNKLKDKNIHER